MNDFQTHLGFYICSTYILNIEDLFLIILLESIFIRDKEHCQNAQKIIF